MSFLVLNLAFFAFLLLSSTTNALSTQCNGCDVTRGGCPGCACFLNRDEEGNCDPICTPCAPCPTEFEVDASCEIYESCPFGCTAIDRGGLLCSCTGSTTTCPGNQPVGPTDGLFMCQSCKNNLVPSTSQCCINTCENPTASQTCRCAFGDYCTCSYPLVYDSTTESCIPLEECPTPAPACPGCETSTWDGCNVCDCTGEFALCTLRACFEDQVFDPRCFTDEVTCPENCLEYSTGCQNCTCRSVGGVYCTDLDENCDGTEQAECLECENNLVWNPAGSRLTPTCDDPNPSGADVPTPRCECPDGFPYYDAETQSCIREDECPVTPAPVCPGCTTSTWDGCNTCGCDPPFPFCTLVFCPIDQLIPPRCFTDEVTCPDNCLEYNTGCQNCSRCSAAGAFCTDVDENCEGTEIPECVECRNNLVWNPFGAACTPTCDNRNPICPLVITPRCECPSEYPFYDENTQSCIAEEDCTVVPAPECENCNTRSFDGCNECDCTDPTRPACTRIGCPPEAFFTDGSRCLDPNTECSINCLEYNNGCQTCSCRDSGAYCNQIECVTNGPNECLDCVGDTVQQDCPRRGAFRNCEERDTCEFDETICNCPYPWQRYDPDRDECVFFLLCYY